MHSNRDKKLRIGPSIWTVKYIDDLVDGDDTILHGDSDSETKTIRINSSFELDAQNKTLFHESMHAALYESGMAFVISSDVLEEGIVRALENSLWPILKSLISNK